MPYVNQSRWIPAKRFIKWKGVVVYHTYTEDDVERGEHAYQFTIHPDYPDYPDCGCSMDCQHVFDVQELPNGTDSVETKHIQRVIREAIEEGYIDSTGLKVLPHTVTIQLKLNSSVPIERLRKTLDAYLQRAPFKDGLLYALGVATFLREAKVEGPM